jgi:hypothetical protein
LIVGGGVAAIDDDGGGDSSITGDSCTSLAEGAAVLASDAELSIPSGGVDVETAAPRTRAP